MEKTIISVVAVDKFYQLKRFNLKTTRNPITQEKEIVKWISRKFEKSNYKVKEINILGKIVYYKKIVLYDEFRK